MLGSCAGKTKHDGAKKKSLHNKVGLRLNLQLFTGVISAKRSKSSE